MAEGGAKFGAKRKPTLLKPIEGKLSKQRGPRSVIRRPNLAVESSSRMLCVETEKVRKHAPSRTFGPPRSALFRGREQDLFCFGYILSAQLGFRPALRNLIGGSISGEFDARQEGRIAVLMEHQSVRA